MARTAYGTTTPAALARDVAARFAPTQIARRIQNTESYGTPVLDKFFPPSVRRTWPLQRVYLRTDDDVRRAVPVVARGSEGLAIPNKGRKIIEVDVLPVFTRDGIDVVRYNEAKLYGQAEGAQAYVDMEIDRHLDVHMKTHEAIAAQSLTGTIDYPLADETGEIVDSMVVDLGAPIGFVPSVDWTADATTVADIIADLDRLVRERARKGYGTAKDDIVVGSDAYTAVYKKLQGATNDARFPGRVLEAGGIQVGEYTLRQMNEEYYHPVNGHTGVISLTEVLAYDRGQPFAHLRVPLDKWNVTPQEAALGYAVVVKMNDSETKLNVWMQSRKLPVPPTPTISRFDATATA